MLFRPTPAEPPVSESTITIHLSGTTLAACRICLSVRLGPEDERWWHGAASWDVPALFAVARDPQAYGGVLEGMVFCDQELANGWRDAWTLANQHRTRVSVYIVLDSTLSTLAGVCWEQLPHPVTRRPLALYQLVTLARQVSRLDSRPQATPMTPDLKVLLVVSNPTDIERYRGLGALQEVADTVQQFEHILAPLPVQVIAREARDVGAPATSKRVIDALSRANIVITIAHGRLIDGEHYLYLEAEDGSTLPMSATEIASAVSELQHRPRLWVVASCESGGTTQPDPSHAVLGSLLVRSGVPAAIGMLDRITISSALTFVKALVQALRENGDFDLAVAGARRSLRASEDWWQPVLFRDPSATLFWSSLAMAPPQPSEPPSIVNRPELVRRNSLEHLRKSWKEQAALSLIGPSGSGKSTLAAQLLAFEDSSLATPVLWYDCREPPPGGLVHALAGWLAHEGYRGPWERLMSLQKSIVHERSAIVSTMTELLAGSARVLCVDHAEFAAHDQELWVVLVKLEALSRLSGLRLLVVARQACAQLDIAIEKICGLCASEVAQLPICRQLRLSDEQIALLQRQTAGNPTLLRYVTHRLRCTGRWPEQGALSLSEDSAIQRFLCREFLDAQDDRARSLLEAIAVLRPEYATTQSIAALTGQSALETTRTLEQLQIDGLIDAIIRDRVVIAELLITHIYEDLSPERRCMLHRRAAAHYEGHERRSRELPLRWLHHLANAGMPQFLQALQEHGHNLLRQGYVSLLQELLRTFEEKAFTTVGMVEL